MNMIQIGDSYKLLCLVSPRKGRVVNKMGVKSSRDEAVVTSTGLVGLFSVKGCFFTASCADVAIFYKHPKSANC